MSRLADYELPPNHYCDDPLVEEARRSGTSEDWRADLEINRFKRRAEHRPYAAKHRRQQHR